jgi:hypothetical protein
MMLPPHDAIELRRAKLELLREEEAQFVPAEAGRIRQMPDGRRR